MNVPVLPDNATASELGIEPAGFWDHVHDDVDTWLAMYGEVDDNIGRSVQS